MMLPILISVSVAPVSYFFCASAPLPDAASTASAVAEATTILLVMTGMIVSLFSICMDGVCHGLLGRKLFEPRALSTILPDGSQEKALRAGARRAASLVVRRLERQSLQRSEALR